jgi:hypothetical protein
MPKTPGFTTRRMSVFKIDNISGVTVNVTVRFSAGFSAIRSNRWRGL